MDYYNDIYLKRLNRYGLDYQSRVQQKRELNFEQYLLKSVYRVDFYYDGEAHPGTLEKYKQDETETFGYLLTRTSLNIPSGTILMLQDKDMKEKPWMVYYLEEIKASGYNRYIMVKMTHYIRWTGRDKNVHESWVYMYGQEDGILKDELKSRSGALYTENTKANFFLMPLNEHIRKDDYLEIGEGILKEAYRVTGYDIQSTPGVEYVTVDPIYIYDNSPEPVQTPEDKEEDFFWLNGGN